MGVRVLKVLPGMEPEVVEIGQKFEDLMSLIGDFPEAIHPTTNPNLACYLDECGLLKKLRPNFQLAGYNIVGPAVFVLENEEANWDDEALPFEDMSDQELKALTKLLSLSSSTRAKLNPADFKAHPPMVVTFGSFEQLEAILAATRGEKIDLSKIDILEE